MKSSIYKIRPYRWFHFQTHARKLYTYFSSIKKGHLTINIIFWTWLKKKILPLLLIQSNLTYSKPLVIQHFLYGNPMIYIRCEHSLYEILGRFTNIVPQWCLHLQVLRLSHEEFHCWCTMSCKRYIKVCKDISSSFFSLK